MTIDVEIKFFWKELIYDIIFQRCHSVDRRDVINSYYIEKVTDHNAESKNL